MSPREMRPCVGTLLRRVRAAARGRAPGQGLVEYGLILMLVAAGLLGVLLLFGERLAVLFAGFAATLGTLL